jgi:hypothetical protein
VWRTSWTWGRLLTHAQIALTPPDLGLCDSLGWKRQRCLSQRRRPESRCSYVKARPATGRNLGTSSIRERELCDSRSRAARRACQTARARWRLRHRSPSMRDLPSACFRARNSRAGGWTRPWVTAIRCRAQLSCGTRADAELLAADPVAVGVQPVGVASRHLHLTGVFRPVSSPTLAVVVARWRQAR